MTVNNLNGNEQFKAICKNASQTFCAVLLKRLRTKQKV